MASGDLLSYTQARGMSAAPGSLWFVELTSGGTTPISAGVTITGDTSGATAVVMHVHLRSGSFAGGDAVGFMLVRDVSGSFVIEDIDSGNATLASSVFANTARSEVEYGLYSVRLDLGLWTGVVADLFCSPAYSGGDGEVAIWYRMKSPTTSKSVRLIVLLILVTDGGDNVVDVDSEDAVTRAVPAAALEFDKVTVTIAAADMPAAGTPYRLMVIRDGYAAADDAGTELLLDFLAVTEA